MSCKQLRVLRNGLGAKECLGGSGGRENVQKMSKTVMKKSSDVWVCEEVSLAVTGAS